MIRSNRHLKKTDKVIGFWFAPCFKCSGTFRGDVKLTCSFTLWAQEGARALSYSCGLGLSYSSLTLLFIFVKRGLVVTERKTIGCRVSGDPLYATAWRIYLSFTPWRAFLIHTQSPIWFACHSLVCVCVFPFALLCACSKRMCTSPPTN